MNAEETKTVMTTKPAVPTYKLGGIIIEVGDCTTWRIFDQGEQGEVASV
jgi:hypothetical protein